MRDIYKSGMSDEVFAWTAASNNQAFLAGRLSLALNAISIVRTAEDSGNTRSPTTRGSPRSREAPPRLGNEHVMGTYLIWKFAKNKDAAKKYVVDQQLAYRDHFIRSKFYNFPPWTGAIKGGFKEIRKITPGSAQAEGQVLDPDHDRREVHDQPRSPRQLHAGDRARSTTRS